MATAVLRKKRPRYHCRAGQPHRPRPLPPTAARRSPPAQPARHLVTDERVAEYERQHADLHQALFEAAWIHRKISAPRQLQRGNFEIASETFAVRHLSGDFLCARDVGGATALAVGDIAGKGIGACMWTTFLAGLFHLHAASAAGPASAAISINRALCLLRPAAPLATMFLTRLDWQSGELDYCNAGHPPALLLRSGGAVERLEDGGPLLGGMPDASFRPGRATLRPGDTLVAFSDGLVECRNAQDREFGIERLIGAARRSLGSSCGQMVFSLLAAVNDFAGNQPRDDDISIMVVRHNVRPAAAV